MKHIDHTRLLFDSVKEILDRARLERDFQSKAYEICDSFISSIQISLQCGANPVQFALHCGAN